MFGDRQPTEGAQTRDSFSGKRGFILASIGSAVGMGNIWRFPAMVSLWGGMTFIIPYLIFVVLISASGVIGEFALGRAAGAGPSGAFGMCTERRYGNRKIGERIGLIPVIGSLALAIGYTCVVAWIIKYTCMAFSGDLFGMGQDMDVISGTFNDTASAWGANAWVVVAVVATLVIMSLGVSRGIERANNILMPVLFVLLIGLAIYVGTLPGASAGYSYILTIDFDLLANPLVWIFAFGQAFFSLSVAGNGSVIYGSYFKKNESIPSAAFYVALFDTISAFLAAMVIIPAMAAGGAELNEGGPGLMFVYIVNVFNGMAGGQIIGIVFFVSVLFAGMASSSTCTRPRCHSCRRGSAPAVSRPPWPCWSSAARSRSASSPSSPRGWTAYRYTCAPWGRSWRRSCSSGSPEAISPWRTSTRVPGDRWADGSYRWASTHTVPSRSWRWSPGRCSAGSDEPRPEGRVKIVFSPTPRRGCGGGTSDLSSSSHPSGA